MMLKRFLVLVALMQGLFVQAIIFDAEDRAEVVACWQDRIWREELASSRAESKEWRHYADVLVDFTDEDLEVVGQLIKVLCSKQMWNEFVDHRDFDTTMKFIQFMTMALQRYIAEDCQIPFPPHLQDIKEEITRSGLSEEEFCTKLRQAFLTFIILVSNMDQMTRQVS